ncbi:hypothetical protein V1477_017155 [Vespula maculifrons]|uniref:Uncharacterized protein n=2 Tax=Vespula TaxID=7451 RepID=A0A834NA72_VESVU|nr:hypothetical protein HZH66_005868 [Vespula vulgaris]
MPSLKDACRRNQHFLAYGVTEVIGFGFDDLASLLGSDLLGSEGEFMGVRALNGNYGSRKVVSLGHNFVDSQENVAAICPWARPRRKGPFAIIWGAGCRMQTT